MGSGATGRLWSGREGSAVDRAGIAAGGKEQGFSERDECLE